MSSLHEYLKTKYMTSTVKIYLFEIEKFIAIMGEEQARKATYNDIMKYLEILRNMYNNPLTIRRIIYAIRAYYFYLIDNKIRNTHPCRSLKLKDAKNYPLQLQDLFNREELAMLMERKERYPMLELRNKLIMSLLIYQGLTVGEIINTEQGYIDLEAGTINIRESAKQNARTLKLETMQIMLIYRYIHEIRTKLIKTDTQKLILTARGTPENGDGINYLIETYKPLFPVRNLNSKTIRMSVIRNHLKSGMDLRKVQVFAGHKHIKTTEKYKQSMEEELKNQIMKYHPLS